MSDVVDLSIPVRADLVVLARLAASTVASRAGFDVEEIEDLRLAVDELCVSVAGRAGDGRLELRFELDGDQVEVSCELVGATAATTPAADAGEPFSGYELSTRILTALVDGHGDDHDHGRPRAWLRKRRAVHQGAG